MVLVTGQEGVGARRRILGTLPEDEEVVEDSGDWD